MPLLRPLRRPFLTRQLSQSSPKHSYGQFGSFANEDVELTAVMPDEQYVESLHSGPLYPLLEQMRTDIGLGSPNPATPIFGRPVKEAYFHLDPSWTFINHGAFGAPFMLATQAADWWRKRAELQPLRHIDRELLPGMVHSLRALAKFLNASPAEVALVQNATSALNAVISSRVEPGDKVFIMSTAYGSVKKMVSRAGADITICDLSLNKQDGLLDADDILSLVKQSLPSNCKLAIFDHVASNTAIKFPVERLIQLCEDRHIETLIDGAHGPGSVGGLDLSYTKPDYYVGNCHKWLCCPRGVGFLFSPSARHGGILPALTSHGAGHGFISEFLWDGARDYSAALALPVALEIWENRLSVDAASSYVQNLCIDASRELRTAWGSPRSTDGTVPNDHAYGADLHSGMMDLIKLPEWVKYHKTYSQTPQALQDWLHHNHKIEVPIKKINDQMYVRISSAVYNELEEYKRLGEVLRDPHI